MRLRLLCILGAIGTARAVLAQDADAAFLRDRGPGIRTSIFGTYVRRGELLISPFVEYYRNHDAEYKPSELGFTGSSDFRGRFTAREGLIFLAYGITDRLALELEAATIDATQEKSPADGGNMPAKYSESGPGDMQAQLDVTLVRERANRPEIFGFFETVFPSNKTKPLIGTPDFEYKAGVGLIRGLAMGTVTVRVAAQHADDGLELGEWAFEFLRRVSPRWRVYAGVEGTQDEIEALGEVQWHPSPRWYVRLNNGFGVTSKAVDLAPDVGVVFSLPLR